MKQIIETLITAALQHLRETKQLNVETFPSVQIDNTKDKQHGDFSSNIALILAKPTGKKPSEIAKLIIQALPASADVTRIDIAGPGFINFFLAPTALHSIIKDVLAAGEKFGFATFGNHKKVLIEFVSTNPTGPLHVGHGRHAAYGSVIAGLLAAVGYDVTREYYINDAGRQMDILAASVWLRYLELNGEKLNFPANAYKGDYIVEIARILQEQHGKDFSVSTGDFFRDLPLDEPQGGDKEIYIDAVIDRLKKTIGESKYRILFDISLKNILDNIRNELDDFGVKFDNWFSERDFVSGDKVTKMIHSLEEKELTYVRDEAVWFRSTSFDDEKDRVLQRSNGQHTYFANDLAYHINKFERGFDFAIDIFGSDHHGYIPRMRSGLQAFGISSEKLTYLLMQFVSLYRQGKQVQMSTRSGSFVTLSELRDEVGNDAARFFYVMRKAEQPMDFDLDLAKSQSNENPVYYVQYAYARICSVFRQMKEKSLIYVQAEGLDNLSLLTAPQELKLIATIARYPETIKNAAQLYEPHLLTHYLRDLATDFHGYYNSEQFLVENNQLRNARLALIIAARQVLTNGLKLLGVSAPESM